MGEKARKIPDEINIGKDSDGEIPEASTGGFEVLPSPSLFISDAKERHEQAKALCEKYPELKGLNTEKMYKHFGLFNTDKLIE